MLVLAVVGGAGKRQLLVAEAIGIRGAAFDQRQRLHGLAGGTRKDARVDIANGKDHLSITIDCNDRAAMPALDESATGNFDGNGIGHGKNPD